MDDLSDPEQERIREVLSHRAQAASPPPGYHPRVRRQARWRAATIMGGLVLAVSAIAIAVGMVLPSEGRRTPAAPASPDALTVELSGELIFTQGGRSIQTLTLPDGAVTPAEGGDVETTDLQVSPDGRFVAYAVGLGPYMGELRVLDLETGRSETIVRDEGTIMSPMWSAEGGRIVFVAETYEQDPSIPIFRTGFVKPDGSGKRFVDEPQIDPVRVQLSPDGSWLVYLDAHSDVFRLDMDTGESSLLWSRKEGGAANKAVLSPDGAQLAVVAGGALYLAPIDEPEAVQPVETGLGIFDVAWMPDGQGLILSAEKTLDDDADLYAFDLTTGSPILLPSTSDDDFEPSIAAPATESG